MNTHLRISKNYMPTEYIAAICALRDGPASYVGFALSRVESWGADEGRDGLLDVMEEAVYLAGIPCAVVKTPDDIRRIDSGATEYTVLTGGWVVRKMLADALEQAGITCPRNENGNIELPSECRTTGGIW